MRNLLTITTGITLLATAACDSAPDTEKDPPVLKVTSPMRSLRQDRAGQILVTGTVAPNDVSGEPVEKVLVNNVQATVNADGTFQALIAVKAGATLIHTTARDHAGREAADTRSVQSGSLRPVGSNVENAITAALSKEAFAKIAGAAGPMIKGLDMHAMLAPMQPMVHMGDAAGEDCLFARVYVDDVKMSDVKISLTPVAGGLTFRAQIDGLDVPTHARYAAACVNGTNNIRVTADRVVVGGTLLVTPDGVKGFKTTLADETVQMTNLHIDASGIPGTILDLINMDSAIQYIVSKGAEMAMEPMMNTALGGLAGPKTLDVMGKKLDVEVAASDISFDPTGALVTLDTKMLIEGSEGSPGFVFTDNGAPAMDAGHGFQLGLADDLANEMMAEFSAIGMLNLAMPQDGGTFDSSAVAMTLPPMISADPANGQMRVVLGDMMVTYTDHGVPVAKAAMNATVELEIVSAGNGYSVALELGTPTIHVDVLDDIANVTGFTNKDLGTASEICLQAQIAAISKLLSNIPVPSVAGLQMRNLSVGSDDGYVMVKGDIE
jgi:hypothetical protein